MRVSVRTIVAAIHGIWMMGLLVALAAGQEISADDTQFFEQHIRPLLERHCYECHSAQGDTVESGLQLDSRPAILQGGDSGPAIVPGKPEESLLIKALSYSDDEAVQMPPDGKLPNHEIALLVEWVRRGAPDPRDQAIESSKLRQINLEEESKHWAYQPLQEFEIPKVRDRNWCRTPIDHFVLARLESEGIAPNESADRRTLIRRLYFDVIGLPPTPNEVDDFVNDQDPNAYERLVDRLLASPHFGERWARHWLDIARFAESHGFEQDYDRPHAFHYRDFVIRAINEDLPYDTFLKWQLAGDEFAPANIMALQATGFLAAGVHATQITANQAEKERYDELDDMTRTVGTTMLGLTVGCARCHDHKFDPIPDTDYYGLAATFTTTVRCDYPLEIDPEVYRAELAQLTDTGVLLEPAFFEVKDENKQTGLVALVSSEGVPAIRLNTQGPDFYDQTFILKRGDPNQKVAEAQQRFLTVLMRHPNGTKHWSVDPPKNSRTSYRRTALANWITDVDYGAGNLAARVIVNRLWQHHLGRGIVATPSDFGTQGARPTHPELLDWLASTMVRGGWQLKPIHKLILMSSVYMQSGTSDHARASVDPDNTLWWRRAKNRMDAEVIRDAMLAVSGQLDVTMFGPGSKDVEMKRRSIYFFVKRSKLNSMMTLFDSPDTLQDVAIRSKTTVAPQSLLMMNSPIVRRYAKGFAQRASELRNAKVDRIRAAYEIAIGRGPTDAELADAQVFLQAQAQCYADTDASTASQLAFEDFCHGIFCLNEFAYVE
jgi:hypothetical protein